MKGKLQKRIVTQVCKGRVLGSKIPKTIKVDINFQIKSDKMKNSWNQAVLDALSARKNFENDEQRCDKLLYDYTDKPKPKPTEKRKSTAKRKSLIPNRKRSTHSP